MLNSQYYLVGTDLLDLGVFTLNDNRDFTGIALG